MEWLEKDKSMNRTEFDGEVILQLEDHSKKKIQFKFRKNSIHKIGTDCEFIVIARDGNKIYFKESDSKRGFRIMKYALNSKIFKVQHSKFPLSSEWFGEYNLEFDSKLGLHYICLDRKLEKQLFWEGK